MFVLTWDELLESCVVGFFPQHKVVGLLNIAGASASSSLLDFLFRDPLQEMEVIICLFLLLLLFFFCRTPPAKAA